MMSMAGAGGRRLAGLPEDRDELLPQDFPDADTLLRALLFHPGPDSVEDRGCGFQTGVGADQDLLEFVPEVVCEVGPFEEAAQPAEEAAPGPFDGALSLFVNLGLLLRGRLEHEFRVSLRGGSAFGCFGGLL
jgi:hypothetical protein